MSCTFIPCGFIAYVVQHNDSGLMAVRGDLSIKVAACCTIALHKKLLPCTHTVLQVKWGASGTNDAIMNSCRPHC